jgi:hypothetical protein
MGKTSGEVDDQILSTDSVSGHRCIRNISEKIGKGQIFIEPWGDRSLVEDCYLVPFFGKHFCQISSHFSSATDNQNLHSSHLSFSKEEGRPAGIYLLPADLQGNIHRQWGI